jgi:hypothetical protein
MHMRSTWFVTALGGLGLVLVMAQPARSDEIPQEYRATVDKGLKWLVDQQQKDGHWEAQGGQYPVTMTGVAGMALLCEGSTIREGKYKDNIRRATEWLMKEAYWDNGGAPKNEVNGLLVNPQRNGESGRYMYGHGFALLFLSCVYGEEEDNDRRKELEKILTAACKYTRAAQTNRGGWGYVAAREGNNFDEGSVTITQVQALRAARNAGIAVPPEAIRDAQKYLKDSTNGEGGVIYSLGNGGGGDGRPALTAAAISCGYGFGDYNSELVKKWFLFCRNRIGGNGARIGGHDEYTHYYYAQALYILGDDGWAKLFPNDKGESLTWSKYRKGKFDELVRSQGGDGSWSGGHVGPVFITSVHLTIMQLDKAVLPIYTK